VSLKIPATSPHRLSAEPAYRVVAALVKKLKYSSPSPTRCRYCEHGNPADSKFCSACGGALQLSRHLASCLRCGTVNPVKATVCCWCNDELPGRRTDAPAPSSPAAEVSRPLLRWPSRVIAGTAVLAAIVVLGYHSYRQRSLAEAPQPPDSSSEASGRGAPAGAGVIGRNAAAGNTKSAKDDKGAGLISPAAPPSGIPLAPPARAVADQPRAGRQSVESREARATAAAIARPQATSAGRAGGQGPPPQACSEAVAALALCAASPVQKKEAETAAAVEEAIKRPQTTDAGKAGGQEPPVLRPCTEAIAALGLCTPRPTQGRE